MKNCDIKIKYRTDLDLKEEKQITALPDNLSVGGSLYLSGSGITVLPENLRVGRHLFINHTEITKLPENLILGGSVYFRGSRLAAIQDKFKVLGTPVGTIREDLFATLAKNRNEAPGLLKAIREGARGGMVHNGDGAWLMGTIASMRGCSAPGNSRNCESSAERWFSLIHPGDTPETSSAAKITEDWVMEFLRSASIMSR